jgi:hypothetical protein
MDWRKVCKWFGAVIVVGCLLGATITGVFMVIVEHHRGTAAVFQNVLQPLGAWILSVAFVYRELLTKGEDSGARAVAESGAVARAASTSQQSVSNIIQIPPMPAPVINIDDKLIKDRLEKILGEAPDFKKERIEAKSFVLTDSEGRRRAVFSTSEEDPFLAFLDKTGLPELLLSGGDLTHLVLLRGGKRRLTLCTDNKVDAELISLSGPNGESQLSLSRHRDGTVAMKLGDANGEPRCLSYAVPSGEAAFSMHGRGGNARLAVSLGEDDRPEFTMKNRQGNFVSCYGESDDGTVSIAFYDQSVNPRAVMGTGPNGPQISILSEDGKVLPFQNQNPKS